MKLYPLLAVALFLAVPVLPAEELTREEKVRGDKARVEAEGFWIYNDLDRAYETAKQTGKPILVVLRCLPCEECVKLDDEVVDNDPVIRPLLEKFVCVRVVGTNGLDLGTFQYDTDQSFAVFMLNADKTIYGRFGTRSHRTEWVGDVSLKGMAAALEGALALHARYPANQQGLAGKRGKPLEFGSPEQYPSLKQKYTDRLNYEGDVVKSCIHCHQIGDARREFYWHSGKPIPDELLLPYPHPKSIGLVLDPNHRARVKEVLEASPAQDAGLRVGDEVLRMNGQPLLSMADIQWVLHNQPNTGGNVQLSIRRNGQVIAGTLILEDGWRHRDDTFWRVASWPMRRIATGGMRLQSVAAEDREKMGITEGMALEAISVGQYGPHGAAKRAGFRKGDILVAFDQQTDLIREQDLFYYVNRNRRPGDVVQVTLLREGQRKTLPLKIQR